MKPVYDLSAAKKPINLTVNSDLLSQAKALGINVSAVLEQSLAEKVRTLKHEAWLLENEAAIATYNEDVTNNGAFSDNLRSF